MAASGTQAHADTITFTGDTTGGPTFNRTTAGNPPTSLSSTTVRYVTSNLVLTVAGSYQFATTSSYDNFSALYSNTFNSATPLTNVLIANDDLVGLNSGFTKTLSAGNYVLVTTGFSNTSFGSFSSTITGPGPFSITSGAGAGSVSMITPEPETWAMMLIGVGAVALFGWKRKRSEGETSAALAGLAM